MSQAKHVYRNTKNHKVGELTEAQAAIWPDLLVRVDEVEQLAEVPADQGAEAPAVAGASEAQSPARTKKKD